MTEQSIIKRIRASQKSMARYAPGTSYHTRSANTERRLRRELACFRATGKCCNWQDYEPAEV